MPKWGIQAWATAEPQSTAAESLVTAFMSDVKGKSGQTNRYKSRLWNVTGVCRILKRKTSRRTKDRKVTPELQLKKRLGICSNYIGRLRKEAITYQHWYFGCQQHPLAKDPLLHSSLTQQQGHNKELKVGKWVSSRSCQGGSVVSGGSA